MTFSIAARCGETGMFGVAVSSSSPAVAARCAFVRAGVGAVLSQNITDPRLGPRALDLLELGAGAGETIEILRRTAAYMAYRQVLVVDNTGGSAVHSGDKALGVYADATAVNVAVGGNLLADATVPAAMVAAFEAADGHPGDRLVSALRAGLDAGGEAGPVHSAGLKLAADVDWPIADLRVDWTEKCPISELADLWTRYKPLLDDYVTRALDPTAAPSFGVPGDD